MISCANSIRISISEGALALCSGQGTHAAFGLAAKEKRSFAAPAAAAAERIVSSSRSGEVHLHVRGHADDRRARQRREQQSQEHEVGRHSGVVGREWRCVVRRHHTGPVGWGSGVRVEVWGQRVGPKWWSGAPL